MRRITENAKMPFAEDLEVQQLGNILVACRPKRVGMFTAAPNGGVTQSVNEVVEEHGLTLELCGHMGYCTCTSSSFSGPRHSPSEHYRFCPDRNTVPPTDIGLDMALVSDCDCCVDQLTGDLIERLADATSGNTYFVLSGFDDNRMKNNVVSRIYQRFKGKWDWSDLFCTVNYDRR